MTKSKILITFGCSFADINLSQYKTNNIRAWPILVSDKLNMDLLSLGRGAASNSYIENCVFDAVLKYKNHDPIIMVLWTNPRRSNIGDCVSKFTNLKDLDFHENFKFSNEKCNGGTSYDFDAKDACYRYIRASLRNIWRTRYIARDHNLEYYDNLAGCWTAPYPHFFNKHNSSYLDNISRIQAKIQNDWYFKNLNFKLKNIERGFQVSGIPGDGHPDQNGHEEIAQMFIKKYMKKFYVEDYVYD